MEILQMKNVNLTYQSLDGETNALSNITFNVEEREFIAIVGPSGCGKTTILSLIAGLIKPSSGTIILGNRQIDRPSSDVGYMLQRDQLFEWRTIESNILLGLQVQKNLTPENKEYAKELLNKYGLAEFAKRHPNELSGGMRQSCLLYTSPSPRD